MLYSEKLVSNQTRISVCTASYFYFRYSLSDLGNLSMASFFAHNGGACAAEPSLVTKKREL